MAARARGVSADPLSHSAPARTVRCHMARVFIIRPVLSDVLVWPRQTRAHSQSNPILGQQPPLVWRLACVGRRDAQRRRLLRAGRGPAVETWRSEVSSQSASDPRKV
eukprot:3493828-Prymnesium_polylepis.1